MKSTPQEGTNALGFPILHQSDFPRLIEGDIRVVFAVACAFDYTNGNIEPSSNPDLETYKQINEYHHLERISHGKVFIIRDKSDLRKVKHGYVGFLLHCEGADMLSKNPDSIDTLFNLGVRSLGLTWNYKNGLASGALAQGGLTKKGKEIIRRMENMGMLVDLAHLNTRSAHEAVGFIRKPCIISHTNCLAIYNHPRNVDDQLMKKVAKNGGVVCISGVPSFVGKSPTIEMLCEHIEHAVNICGENGVGIGSDFSAMTEQKLIKGYSQASDMKHLINVLSKRMPERIIMKVCHDNMLRILRNSL